MEYATMNGVEKFAQMSDVERMRENMNLISDKMHKQNDKDRMEMLAMLASTTTTDCFPSRQPNHVRLVEKHYPTCSQKR